MQLRNDYDRNVFNGDVGLRREHRSGRGHALRPFRRAGASPSTRADLNDLVLAYACTVHKSQGSEYPAVVIPLFTTHFMMLSKNLLYTAVTRGKRLVVLVADGRALELALSSRRQDDRRTHLAERLAYSAHHA